MKKYKITTGGLINNKVQYNVKMVSEAKARRYQTELDNLQSQIGRLHWLTDKEKKYAIANPYMVIEEIK